MGTELHPDKYGGAIPCEEVNHGRNRDMSPFPEHAYVRCKKCGFPMNAARHPKGIGTGIDIVTEGTHQVPEVTGGCPFCGTYNYD